MGLGGVQYGRPSTLEEKGNTGAPLYGLGRQKQPRRSFALLSSYAVAVSACYVSEKQPNTIWISQLPSLRVPEPWRQPRGMGCLVLVRSPSLSFSL